MRRSEWSCAKTMAAAGSGEAAYPVVLEVVHVDTAHEGDVALLVRLVRRAALLRHLDALLVRHLRVDLLGALAADAGRGDTLARAPRRDVQREERVELEHGEVVLVADEKDEVRDVLCRQHGMLWHRDARAVECVQARQRLWAVECDRA